MKLVIWNAQRLEKFLDILHELYNRLVVERCDGREELIVNINTLEEFKFIVDTLSKYRGWTYYIIISESADHNNTYYLTIEEY